MSDDAQPAPTDLVTATPAPELLTADARAQLHQEARVVLTALTIGGGTGWTLSTDIMMSVALDDAQALATQHEKVATTMDVLGVPRSRQEHVFSLEERVSLFVDRLSERLHTQVENNMLYFNLCREVVVLLKGSPNASNFRVKTAIAKLEAATIPSGQTVQSLTLLD